jgi:hypothetical protein
MFRDQIDELVLKLKSGSQFSLTPELLNMGNNIVKSFYTILPESDIEYFLEQVIINVPFARNNLIEIVDEKYKNKLKNMMVLL